MPPLYTKRGMWRDPCGISFCSTLIIERYWTNIDSFKSLNKKLNLSPNRLCTHHSHKKMTLRNNFMVTLSKKIYTYNFSNSHMSICLTRSPEEIFTCTTRVRTVSFLIKQETILIAPTNKTKALKALHAYLVVEVLRLS